MSCRGRGTLTVRRSDNPFFQTTTGDIGQDFTKEVEYAAPTVERAPPRRTLVDNYDFGFLYEKMSDDIGAGQHHAPSNLSRAMGAQDTPAQLTRLKTMGAPASAATIAAAESRPSAADRVERILEIYKHAPKKEHEMYMTTSNVIGAPAERGHLHRRAARAEPLLKPVPGVKYRNRGPHDGGPKSNVHCHDQRDVNKINANHPGHPKKRTYTAALWRLLRAARIPSRLMRTVAHTSRTSSAHCGTAAPRGPGSRLARVLRALGVALEPGRSAPAAAATRAAPHSTRPRAEAPVGAGPEDAADPGAEDGSAVESADCDVARSRGGVASAAKLTAATTRAQARPVQELEQRQRPGRRRRRHAREGAEPEHHASRARPAGAAQSQNRATSRRRSGGRWAAPSSCPRA